MDFRNRSGLHNAGCEALCRALGDPRKMVLYYAGIMASLSALSLFLTFYLDQQIEGTGGLSMIGQRSVLSTIQNVLPIVQMVLLTALQLGYHMGILRIFRRQPADQQTLFQGFQRFGPWLRALLLEGVLLGGLMLLALYVSAIVFSLLPVAESFLTASQPLFESAALTGGAPVMDEALMDSLLRSMKPMLWIYPPVAALLVVPMLYRYRMTVFCLSEDTRSGALAAMRRSRMMLRRNRFALFRLDLTFWWYYLLLALAMVLAQGDLLLAMLNVSLPMSGGAAYLLFGVLGIAAQFAIQYFLMNRVTITYAAAYEALQTQ